MSEESERLREKLAQLQGELDSAESIDPEIRAPLRAVMEDLLSLLDPSDTATAAAEQRRRSVLGRLSAMTLRFETSHPTIAGTLNQLTHMLSSMGI